MGFDRRSGLDRPGVPQMCATPSPSLYLSLPPCTTLAVLNRDNMVGLLYGRNALLSTPFPNY